eukprot:9483381-Pyramimonas_sp.AAC.1
MHLPPVPHSIPTPRPHHRPIPTPALPPVTLPLYRPPLPTCSISVTASLPHPCPPAPSPGPKSWLAPGLPSRGLEDKALSAQRPAHRVWRARRW